MTEVVQGPNRMTQDAVRDDVPIEMHPISWCSRPDARLTNWCVFRHDTQSTTGPCALFFICVGVGLEERSLFCTSLRL